MVNTFHAQRCLPSHKSGLHTRERLDWWRCVTEGSNNLGLQPENTYSRPKVMRNTSQTLILEVSDRAVAAGLTRIYGLRTTWTTHRAGSRGRAMAKGSPCATQANQCVQAINQLWIYVRCDLRLREVRLAAWPHACISPTWLRWMLRQQPRQ